MENQKKPNVGFRIKSLKMPTETEFSISEKSIGLPIQGGSSSVNDTGVSGYIAIQGTRYYEIEPDFSFEYLRVLQNLGRVHAEAGLAVENIVKLSNTDFKIEFSNDTKEADAEKWLKHIEVVSSKWYLGNESIRSLSADLILQIAINGCLSAEFVPAKNLKGIEKIVLVDPYTVRVGIDPTNYEVQYFQRPRNLSALTNTSTNGYITLNKATYRYSALRRIGQSLYGVPPLLSALKAIETHAFMTGNVNQGMKKLGALGLLQVLVKELTKQQGESDTAYQARSAAYLDSIRSNVDKFRSTGVITGFQGHHEFKMDGITSNFAGVKDIFEVVETGMISGMKQDPNMLGRRNATTETFGKVILFMLKTGVLDYQAILAKFYEEVIMVELTLAGFRVPSLTVTFDKPSLEDELKEVDRAIKKAEYALKLRDEGIWSQTAASVYITGEKPYDKDFVEKKAAKEKAMQETKGGLDNKRTDPEDLDDSEDTDETELAAAFSNLTPEQQTEYLQELELSINSNTPEYPYYVPEECLPTTDSLEFKKDKRDEFAGSYFDKVVAQFQTATRKFGRSISRTLEELNKPLTETEIQNLVLFNLYKDWQSLFVNKIEPITKSEVSKVYKYYRADSEVFNGKLNPIPKMNLNQQDFRAIDNAARLDTAYMGKFITGEDTKAALFKAVSKVYLEQDGIVGRDKENNKKGVDALRKELGLTILKEDYKLRRIAETTVNRLRAHASARYMEQAGVAEYEIVEVMDRITCPHCKVLNGKSFQVKDAVKLANDMDSVASPDFKDRFPFAVTKPLEEFEKLTKEEMVLMGWMVPPFHPHCRGRLVANL